MRSSLWAFVAAGLSVAAPVPSASSQSIPQPHAGAAAADAAAMPGAAAMPVTAPAASLIAEVVDAIVAAEDGPYERARAIYAWIATHIAYDVDGYLSGQHGDMSALATFQRRTGVCEGYANLFVHMAELAGVEAVKIPGYAKGFDYTPGVNTKRPNHAWIAFRAGGGWRLADPTWGAGHVRDRRFERAFSWWFFDVDPAALALSHLAEEPRWQLTPRPMSRRSFERLAVVPRALLELGLTPETLRRAAESRDHNGFPLVNPRYGVQVLNAPLTSRLESGAANRLELAWPGAEEVIVAYDGKWLPMTRGHDRYTLDVTPTAGPLLVFGRAAGDSEYHTILFYNVR
jgi:hypothetical protein